MDDRTNLDLNEKLNLGLWIWNFDLDVGWYPVDIIHTQGLRSAECDSQCKHVGQFEASWFKILEISMTSNNGSTV